MVMISGYSHNEYFCPSHNIFLIIDKLISGQEQIPLFILQISKIRNLGNISLCRNDQDKKFF